MPLWALQCLLALFAILGLASPVEHHVLPQLNDTAHATAGWNWSDCGLDTDPLQIKSIKVSPNPPQPGKNLTVSVKGDVVSSIEDGAYVDVSVKLGLVKLLKKTFDFCEELPKIDAGRCPLKPGSFTAHHTATVPREIPRAKLTIRAEGYDVNDDELFCLVINVDFGPRF